MWIIEIIKIKCFYPPPRILEEHWYTYSCLQIPPRKNWFQYNVRREYATSINFSCIITLIYSLDYCKKWINGVNGEYLKFGDFRINFCLSLNIGHLLHNDKPSAGVGGEDLLAVVQDLQARMRGEKLVLELNDYC